MGLQEVPDVVGCADEAEVVEVASEVPIQPIDTRPWLRWAEPFGNDPYKLKRKLLVFPD